ncbi:MAG: ABC transporter ATP-binding protein [Alicyclobacillaceae bacterium]|nr:ABC transporter ATP-binding protein [Alicyclobacillaceae bacterium]
MRDILAFDIQVPLSPFSLVVKGEVDPGVTAILGPSGSGKTTLLRCLAGLTRPAAGWIRFRGRNLFSSTDGVFVPPERRNVGYVPQQYALFPRLTVFGNVEYGLKARRVPARQRHEHVRDMLKRMGIEHLASRMPGSLSGGEAQRVALARAMVLNPDYILLDEPLAALDPQTRHHIREFLRSVLKEASCPVLCVTHDLEDVRHLADRVMVLREGRIVFEGRVEEWVREGPPPEDGEREAADLENKGAFDNETEIES